MTDTSSICVGDLYEGTGTHRIQVEVRWVDGDQVEVRLVRSGRTKTISARTLLTAYRCVGHREQRP